MIMYAFDALTNTNFTLSIVLVAFILIFQTNLCLWKWFFVTPWTRCNRRFFRFSFLLIVSTFKDIQMILTSFDRPLYHPFRLHANHLNRLTLALDFEILICFRPPKKLIEFKLKIVNVEWIVLECYSIRNTYALFDNFG